jgi:EAL domain-containing protein (putative c-di-GMP-specific phosphodiesterase class I)
MGLITNVINLAHSLSLRVVAEGVENEEQAKLLRLLRCDVLQGYFLGQPMPATAFGQLLAHAT